MGRCLFKDRDILLPIPPNSERSEPSKHVGRGSTHTVTLAGRFLKACFAFRGSTKTTLIQVYNNASGKIKGLRQQQRSRRERESRQTCQASYAVQRAMIRQCDTNKPQTRIICNKECFLAYESFKNPGKLTFSISIVSH